MSRRYQRLRQIQTLDPGADHAEICRLITRYEFPWDYRVGFEMSVMTDLLVPSISQVLADSKGFSDDGQKRFDDTMLFEYEIKRSGADSEHGREAVRALNMIHRPFEITNEQFLFVLVSQTLSPIDWINTYGWRRLSEPEIAALVLAARRQGELMGIQDIPADYAGFHALREKFYADQIEFAPVNREVSHHVLNVIVRWAPKPVQPLMAPLVPIAIVALLDPRLPPVLGLTPAPRWIASVVRLGMRLRGRLLRLLPPRKDSRPYRPRPRSYPRGYTVHDFGHDH
jgi:hypothetical protein